MTARSIVSLRSLRSLRDSRSTLIEGIGLNLTVLSNMGNVDFGVIACRELVPDVWDVATGFEAAVTRLRDAAGVPKARVRTPGRKTPATKKKTTTKKTTTKKTTTKTAPKADAKTDTKAPAETK